MFNREEGKTRNNPMGEATALAAIDALQRSSRPYTSGTEQALANLVNAYNHRAYANQNMPLFSKSSAPVIPLEGSPFMEDMLTAETRNGGRLGFLSRDRYADGTRYGIGIDNVGDPYRGVYDGEKSTPLGTLDYGYDGDTVYAGVTPNEKTQAYISALANLLSKQR